VSPAPGFLERYGVRDLARARWLSQITVAEGRRRRGYGRAVLEALHARLVAEAVAALCLRVYDWNEAARRLYARRGYEVVRQFATDAHLRKRLPAPAPRRAPDATVAAGHPGGNGTLSLPASNATWPGTCIPSSSAPPPERPRRHHRRPEPSRQS
jgi:hypothetical protein